MLHLARHRETARVLLRAKADPDARARWKGQTALHRAVRFGRLEVVETLLEAKSPLSPRELGRQRLPTTRGRFVARNGPTWAKYGPLYRQASLEWGGSYTQILPAIRDPKRAGGGEEGYLPGE